MLKLKLQYFGHLMRRVGAIGTYISYTFSWVAFPSQSQPFVLQIWSHSEDVERGATGHTPPHLKWNLHTVEPEMKQDGSWWFHGLHESEVTQLCPTLCNPMVCSLPGSSIRGIFQARILGWVAISFSRGSSQPKVWTQMSHTAGRLYGLSHKGMPIQHRFSLIQNRLGWEQPLAQIFPLFSLSFSRFYWISASQFTVVFTVTPGLSLYFWGEHCWTPYTATQHWRCNPTSNPMMFWQQQLNTSCLQDRQIHGNFGWGVNHQSSREDSQVSSFWLYSLVRHTVPFTEVNGFGQTPWGPYWSFALWLKVFGRVDWICASLAQGRLTTW